MKAVVQRVTCARVEVDGRTVGAIDHGALVLLGVMKDDDESAAERLAEKIAAFRFFQDERGRMARSLDQVGGAVLAVSQVTLAADGKKGRRPSLDAAAPPDEARRLYEHFVATLRQRGVATETGVFGAMMEVHLVNDGPVTFVLEEAPAR